MFDGSPASSSKVASLERHSGIQLLTIRSFIGLTITIITTTIGYYHASVYEPVTTV